MKDTTVQPLAWESNTRLLPGFPDPFRPSKAAGLELMDDLIVSPNRYPKSWKQFRVCQLSRISVPRTQ